jgi:hypothetical protein
MRQDTDEADDMNERNAPQPRDEDWSDAEMAAAYAEWTDAKEQAYAAWLMEQPEAHICNGDILIQRMESQWRVDEFEREYRK